MTPTSDPHEAQTTDPVFCRLNIDEAYNIVNSRAAQLPRAMRVFLVDRRHRLSGCAADRRARSRRAHGHEPIVFARRARSSGLPGTPVDGDVRDRRAVADAATAVDAICHTAALVSVWRPRRSEFDEVNVGGLQTVLDVVPSAGIPRLVYTSSFLALPPADAIGASGGERLSAHEGCGA